MQEVVFMILISFTDYFECRQYVFCWVVGTCISFAFSENVLPRVPIVSEDLSIMIHFFVGDRLLLDVHCFFRSFFYCRILTLVLLNKLRCHTLFKFSANQIAWYRLLIWIHILNGKQCRSRSVGFFRSQLIWIYTVCKGKVYPGSAGQGLR